jgi:hypothetical protein
MLHPYWTWKFPSADKTCSLQVDLESSKDHADGNVEFRGVNSSEEAVGNDISTIFYMQHTVPNKLQFIHRLHPRGQELFTSMLWI